MIKNRSQNDRSMNSIHYQNYHIFNNYDRLLTKTELESLHLEGYFTSYTFNVAHGSIRPVCGVMGRSEVSLGKQCFSMMRFDNAPFWSPSILYRHGYTTITSNQCVL